MKFGEIFMLFIIYMCVFCICYDLKLLFCWFYLIYILRFYKCLINNFYNLLVNIIMDNEKYVYIFSMIVF